MCACLSFVCAHLRILVLAHFITPLFVSFNLHLLLRRRRRLLLVVVSAGIVVLFFLSFCLSFFIHLFIYLSIYLFINLHILACSICFLHFLSYCQCLVVRSFTEYFSFLHTRGTLMTTTFSQFVRAPVRLSRLSPSTHVRISVVNGCKRHGKLLDVGTCLQSAVVLRI